MIELFFKNKESRRADKKDLAKFDNFIDLMLLSLLV